MDGDFPPPDDFWSNKRCLVTGADAFLAAHLSQRLIHSGAHVYGLVRNRQRLVSRLELFDIKSKMTLFSGDVRAFGDLLDIIAGENIDTVFHLAAHSTIEVANRTPITTLESNIMGTANVLEACRQAGVARILIASSDKAYGDHRSDLPLREGASLRGLHVYDCSKSCVDLIAQTYYFQFHSPVRIVRCSNIYGPGDLRFSRIIPGTIARLMEGLPPIIHGRQAGAQREYLSVRDAADAYLAIAKSISNDREEGDLGTGEEAYSRCAYNVGSGDVRTPGELIGLIQSLMDSRLTPMEFDTPSAPGSGLPNSQFLDSAKVKGELGWEAKAGLEAGLLDTISWYEANREILRPLYRAEINGPHAIQGGKVGVKQGISG